MNVMEMMSLKGKTALVSGGSGLYGKQIVLALAQAGAKVIIASRNIEKNQAYADELVAKGYDVVCEQVDMESVESIKKLAETVKEKYPNLRVLINNSVARIIKGLYDFENFDRSMTINATGNYVMSKLFADIIAENGGGSVVNVGSYMGCVGPDKTNYTGCSFHGFSSPDYFFHKGGLTNLTRYCASFYGDKNVRFNIIQLGGLYNAQEERFVKQYSDNTFLGRMANDTDIMGAIVYLSSDASLYVTGTELVIDGGYLAK